MAMAAMTLLCLTLTYSRGAYVATPFAIATVLLLDRTRTAPRNFLGVGMPVAALMTAVFLAGMILDLRPVQDILDTISDQLQSISYVARGGIREDASMNSRWIAWGEALRYFSESPLVGKGVGYKTMGWFDAHWFRELAETGLLGMGVFIWLQAAAFRLARRTADESRKALGGLALGFLGGQVGLWIHGLTAENFYIVRTSEPFFFLLGVVTVGYMDQIEGASQPELGQERAYALAESKPH